MREAESALREAIAADASNGEAHRLLGHVLANSGRAAQAVEAYRAADALGVADAPSLSNLGFVLLALERNAEAEQALGRAVALDPALAPARGNLGMARHGLGRLDEALADYRAAIALDAGYADAHANCALALWTLGKAEEARAASERAASCPRIGAEALKNLGQLAREMGDGDRALQLLRRAVAIDPAHVMSHYALASELLARGEWREGWREYAWRSRRLAREYPRGADGLPQALAPDLGSVSVALVGEQGPGDMLFFLRYAAQLRQRGARLVFAGEPRMHSLIARTGLFERWLDDPAAIGDDLLRLHVADLPYLLEDHKAAQRPRPLAIAPEPGRLAAARERLAAFGKPPYTAVTWLAGKRPAGAWRNRYFKRIDPARLGAALSGTTGTIVILQRAPLAADLAAFTSALGRTALDASEANTDLEDALAVLGALDRYVGVSNTNMHLAAGLGLKADVLVPNPAEWRWMHAGDSSPWFPGFRVRREMPGRGWDEALNPLP